MKIKIHPLFYLMLAFSYMIGEVKSASLFFIALFIHDFSHYIVAKFYGAKTEELIIFPLGCQMKMNDDYLDANQRIIIYLSGPCINIIIAGVFYILKINGINFTLYNEIVFSHICIGFINLIPLYPMDGSIVLKIVFSRIMGNIRASKLIILITQVVGIVLICLTLYSLWNRVYNLNFGIIGIFFIIQSTKEGQEIIARALKDDLIKRKQVITKNQSVKSERICTNTETKLTSLMSNFHAKKYYIIEVIDVNYNYITTLTEEDILNGIIDGGYDCTIKDILIQ